MRSLITVLAAFTVVVVLAACSADTAPRIANAAPAEAESAPQAPGSENALGAIEKASPEKLAELIAAAEGKVLVLNLWATWCPPCVAEMPYFVEFYNKRNPEKVAFLSVSADDPDTVDDAVKPFIEKQEISFPVHILDSQDPEAFRKALRTDVSGALPTTIFYDANGKVAKVVEQDMTLNELNELTAELLPTR